MNNKTLSKKLIVWTYRDLHMELKHYFTEHLDASERPIKESDLEAIAEQVNENMVGCIMSAISELYPKDEFSVREHQIWYDAEYNKLLIVIEDNGMGCWQVDCSGKRIFMMSMDIETLTYIGVL